MEKRPANSSRAGGDFNGFISSSAAGASFTIKRDISSVDQVMSQSSNGKKWWEFWVPVVILVFAILIAVFSISEKFTKTCDTKTEFQATLSNSDQTLTVYASGDVYRPKKIFIRPIFDKTLGNGLGDWVTIESLNSRKIGDSTTTVVGDIKKRICDEGKVNRSECAKNEDINQIQVKFSFNSFFVTQESKIQTVKWSVP